MTETVETGKQSDKTGRNSSWKSVWISFAIWTILGLSFTSEAYLRHYKADMLFGPAWMYVVEIVSSTYLYGLFSPLVLFLGRKLPLDFKIRTNTLLGHILFHLSASIFSSIFCSYISNVIAYLLEGEACKDCLKLETALDPFLLHRGIVIYWAIIFVGKGLEYFRGYNNEKIRVAELSSQLSEAQLSALKMQIHPHFLFNTLNSIVGLIQEDQNAAETMTTKLSDFLRMTLQSSKELIVTLKQEFYFLKTYLDIEKVRFEERLTTEFAYDENILSAKIPNLILQPLVENSIKHGISHKKENGKIKISAKREKDRLILEVEDNGNRAEKSNSGLQTVSNGLGLKNTEERLRQIYGENFSFKFTDNKENGTTVTINIPFEN